MKGAAVLAATVQDDRYSGTAPDGDTSPEPGLLGDALQRIDRYGASMTLAPGQTIFTENTVATSVYLVIDGVVRLVDAAKGQAILDFLLPGDVIAALTRRLYVCTAETVTTVTLRRYPRQKVEPLLSPVTETGFRLLNSAWHQHEERWQFHALLAGKSPAQRMAIFLHRLARRFNCAAGQPFYFPVTDEDVARHLGLSSAGVWRGNSELSEAGLIVRSSPGIYRIPDPDALVAASFDRATVSGAVA